MAHEKNPYLIGAYGMFWRADEVNWTPGLGRSWQLLGKRGTNSNVLRVCDFRPARGFYILFDDYGATYVGLALGREGIAARLVKHVKNDNKQWSRFCWFSFDDVVAMKGVSGWSEIRDRDAIKEITAKIAVRELEALLIKVLGAKDNVNQMKFIAGKPWSQVTTQDCQPGGALTKIDRGLLYDSELRDYLSELEA
jgi:hypothetical protein